MAKIIKLEENKVVIAKDDETIVRVDYDTLSFRPFVGDEVEIYQDGESYIVNEIIRKNDNDDKININIVNENNSSAVINQTGLDNKKYVNKWIYIVLAIFLGGLGIHRFYAGQRFAILYLLFFWTGIPAFLGLIDAIIALFKKPNNQGLVAFN